MHAFIQKLLGRQADLFLNGLFLTRSQTCLVFNTTIYIYILSTRVLLAQTACQKKGDLSTSLILGVIQHTAWQGCLRIDFISSRLPLSNRCEYSVAFASRGFLCNRESLSSCRCEFFGLGGLCRRCSRAFHWYMFRLKTCMGFPHLKIGQTGGVNSSWLHLIVVHDGLSCQFQVFLIVMIVTMNISEIHCWPLPLSSGWVIPKKLPCVWKGKEYIDEASWSWTYRMF